MIAAMMLPTTYPMLALFRRIVGARGRTPACWWRWSSPGFFARVVRVRPRRARGWMRCCKGWRGRSPGIAAPRLDASARRCWRAPGSFQFSALKYRCLEQCHTPFAFVASRWHGRGAAARGVAARASITALFCVGCCWALMLRDVRRRHGQPRLHARCWPPSWRPRRTCPWGRRLRTPLGVALLAGAARHRRRPPVAGAPLLRRRPARPAARPLCPARTPICRAGARIPPVGRFRTHPGAPFPFCRPVPGRRSAAMKFRFPIVIIDEDFRSENASGLRHPRARAARSRRRAWRSSA